LRREYFCRLPRLFMVVLLCLNSNFTSGYIRRNHDISNRQTD